MKKILIITYYWPPSGGSGVQRWMYFAKYLPMFGFEPIIVTVDPKLASYKFIDSTFEENVKGIEVHRTRTSEPFNIYSRLIGKTRQEAVPQGFSGESNPNLLQRVSRAIRGNLFIPDARKGWVPFAFSEADRIVATEKIRIVITTGPPHSTHLAGRKLKEKHDIKWIADFRDPWTEVYYNKMLYRSKIANMLDERTEASVLKSADMILTIGPGMMSMLKTKLETKEAVNVSKVRYVLNGYDPDAFKDIIRERNTERFVIIHLGVLSDNQPVGGFITALKELSTNRLIFQKLHLKLIGKISPNIINLLKSSVPELSMEIMDYLPHRDAMREIINADLLINSLAETKNAHYLISGKLMEYMATGNPVLCFGDPKGDAAMLLAESDKAIVTDRNDKESIKNYILKSIDDWQSGKIYQRSSTVDKYSRENTARQLAEILNTI